MTEPDAFQHHLYNPDRNLWPSVGSDPTESPEDLYLRMMDNMDSFATLSAGDKIKCQLGFNLHTAKVLIDRTTDRDLPGGRVTGMWKHFSTRAWYPQLNFEPNCNMLRARMEDLFQHWTPKQHRWIQLNYGRDLRSVREDDVIGWSVRTNQAVVRHFIELYTHKVYMKKIFINGRKTFARLSKARIRNHDNSKYLVIEAVGYAERFNWNMTDNPNKPFGEGLPPERCSYWHRALAHHNANHHHSKYNEVKVMENGEMTSRRYFLHREQIEEIAIDGMSRGFQKADRKGIDMTPLDHLDDEFRVDVTDTPDGKVYDRVRTGAPGITRWLSGFTLEDGLRIISVIRDWCEETEDMGFQSMNPPHDGEMRGTRTLKKVEDAFRDFRGEQEELELGEDIVNLFTYDSWFET